jgi:serine/threonine protein kinase
VKLLIEILEVLEYIHHQGVIHRDLKPSNIRRRTKDQKIVIIDFGAVKEIKELHNSKNSTIIGTDGYTPQG